MTLDAKNLELLRINAYTSSQAVAVLRTLGLAREGEDTEALKRAVALKVLYKPVRASYLQNNGQQAKAASFAGRYPYRFTLKFLRWLGTTKPATETIEVALRLGALKGAARKDEPLFDLTDDPLIDPDDFDDEESDDENVP